jgi:hypothetical protein
MMLGVSACSTSSASRQPGAFWGFFASFLLLFFATGVGNASTFQMIPAIMRKEMPADAARRPPAERAGRPRRNRRRSSASPRRSRPTAPSSSQELRHLDRDDRAAPGGALGFLIFYVSCIAITWFVYTRRGGLLHDIERRHRHQTSLAIAGGRNEPLSRSPDVLSRKRAFSDGHGITTTKTAPGRTPIASAGSTTRSCARRTA